MKKKVVVIGAGVSGIAAAVRLKQQGHEVRVLERNDYIGGKVKSIEKNGFIIDQGASILPSKYVNALGMLRELGLADQLEQGGSVVGFARDHQIHYMDSNRLMRDALFTRLISTRSKLSMIKMGLDNLRIRKLLSYEDITRAAALDTESAAQYALRRLNPEILEYIVDATLRGLLGTSAEHQSVVDFFFSFNNVIGSALYCMKGGMGRLPQEIARVAGLDVRLNASVAEVRETAAGVTVSWREASGDKSEQFDGAVVALPALQAAAILPGLPTESQAFLRSVRYTYNINVNLGLRRPPADLQAFVIQIPKSVHPDLFAIVLDHNKAPGRTPAGKGMASLYAMSDWAERMMDWDDQRVLDAFIAAGERVIPGLSGLVEFTNINRWYPVIVYSEPGMYQRLQRFNAGLNPHSRIQLAGDYFSCSNVNTAFAAGERAARILNMMSAA